MTFYERVAALSRRAAKLPSSQQRTKPSVTDLSSSQRARMVRASAEVMALSPAALAMTDRRSANSWTIWWVAGTRQSGFAQWLLGFSMKKPPARSQIH